MNDSVDRQTELSVDAQPSSRERQPSEQLFEFRIEWTRKSWHVELDDRGELGVECRFFEDLRLRFVQFFRRVISDGQIIPARSIAIEWAASTKRDIEAGKVL